MASVTDANIATFAQDLVCDNGDSTALTTFATELRDNELPNLADGWVAATSVTAVTADTPTITVSAGFRKLLALFYGGRELSQEPWTVFETLPTTWRGNTGGPRAWTTVREADLTVRLYPTPSQTSVGSTSFANERDRIVVLGMARANALPLYLRLPAALWALHREYSRESDHRDLAFAKICQALAERMFKMVDGLPA